MRYLNLFGATTLTILSLANLVGCAHSPSLHSNEYEYFTPLDRKDRVIDTPIVTWQIEDNATELCRQYMRKDKNDSDSAYIAPPLACAIWYPNTNKCIIISSKQVSHTILGHEVRHCFEGHFHNNPKAPQMPNN